MGIEKLWDRPREMEGDQGSLKWLLFQRRVFVFCLPKVIWQERDADIRMNILQDEAQEPLEKKPAMQKGAKSYLQ